MAAVFKFKADGSQYTRGLNQMRNETKKFSTGVQASMKSIASFAGLSGLGAMTRSLISFGSEMSDLALRTKTSVKEFMVFRDVARDAGVEQSVLERALRNVVQRTQAAVDGNKTYAKSIERLGLNMQQFNSLSTADKFIEISKAANNAKNENEAFRDIAVILGERAGPMLTEVLKKLATEGFDNLSKSAVTMTDEQAQALDRAEDDIQKFKESSLINLHRFGTDAKSIFSGVRASLAQMAIEAEGDGIFSRMYNSFFGEKTPEQELRIKLAFEEGVFGQELEDMLRERTSKGMAEGIRTAIDITQGLIDAGTPKPEGEDVTKRREQVEGQRKSNLLVGEEDEEALVRIQDEIARGLEEYAEMRKDPFTEQLDLLTKEYDLLQKQNKELQLIDKAKKKTAKDQEKASKDFDKSMQDERDIRDQIEQEKRGREEIGMTDPQILERRKREAKEMQDELGRGTFGGHEDVAMAELDIQRKLTEIKSLEQSIADQDQEDPQTSIISSSLAAIGGGGGVAAFGNDPVLNENKKQSGLLAQLVKLQGGTAEGGTFDNPEL